MTYKEQTKQVAEKVAKYLKAEAIKEITISDVAMMVFQIKDPTQVELRMLGMALVECGWRRVRRSADGGVHWTYIPVESKNRLLANPNRLLSSES